MAYKAKAGREQPGDPAHDQIAAVIRAITALVTGTPNLIGFDIADLRVALIERGRAVLGRDESEGPDRAVRVAEAAIADLKRNLRLSSRLGSPQSKSREGFLCVLDQCPSMIACRNRSMAWRRRLTSAC
jgi:hypothetical protein